MVIKDTPLPEPGVGPNPMTPAQHIQISDRLWEEHLPIELDKGNRLQASEKIWGAVAHAVIAAGKHRNWPDMGEQHSRIRDAAVQLGAELDQDEGLEPGVTGGKEDLFGSRVDGASLMHQNFYRNNKDEDAIEEQSERVGKLLSELEPLILAAPSPYAPDDIRDQRRLARLWGIEVPPNKSPEQEPMLDKLFPKDGVRRVEPLPDDDGGGSGGGVPNPDPKPDGGQGGGAIINGGGGLNLQRRENPDPPDKPAKPVASNSNSRAKRQEPKAPAQYKVAAGPGKERRRVIAPRPTARR